MENKSPQTGPDGSGRPSAAERAVERALGGRRAAYADEVQRLLAAAFALIERSG